MEKPAVIVICAILMGVTVSVHSLQCYICYDCPDGALKDEYLRTCGGEATTVTPTATATTPTVTATTPIATASTPTATATTLIATASSPTATATTPIATASTPTATATTPTATASTPTASNSTDSPINPDNSTSSSTNSTDSSITRDNSTDKPSVRRVRRYVLPNVISLNSGCSCYRKSCACNDNAQALQKIQYADEATTTYVCVKATVKVNETNVVVRTCEPSTVNGTEFCTYVSQTNTDIAACKTCGTDSCNNSSRLQQSFALVLIVSLALFT